MNNFLTSLVTWYKSVKGKAWFVAFEGAFIGFVVMSIQADYQAGKLDLSGPSISHMLLGAIVAGIVAVWHLYVKPTNQAG
jgi:hypothetical protein